MTPQQYRAAIDATRHHATLSEQEAIVVLSALIRRAEGYGPHAPNDHGESAIQQLGAADHQRIERHDDLAAARYRPYSPLTPDHDEEGRP